MSDRQNIMNISGQGSFPAFKKAIAGLTCLIFIFPIYGQTFELTAKINIKARYFTTDALQNVFVVTAENTLIKYDATSAEVFRYSGKINGRLGAVDATNPFTILLYYPDFQTLTILDRTLSETAAFNLYDLDVEQPAAVALSDQNDIWIYDVASAQLKKFVQEANFWKETSQYGVQLPTATPNRLIAREGLIYMNVPASGLYIFDRFGHLFKTLQLKDVEDFQIVEQEIVYRQNGGYFRYQMQNFTTVALTLPQSVQKPDRIRIEKSRLYVQKPDGIEIYDTH